MLSLKGRVTRIIVKPLCKKRTCRAPDMLCDKRFLRDFFKRCGFTLVCYVTILVLFLAAVSHFNVSPLTRTISLDFMGDKNLGGHVLNAVYKSSKRNPDGSIDLVFNVPVGARSLADLEKQMLNNSGIDPIFLQKPTAKVPNTTLSPKQTILKTKYPLTLDADYVINSVAVCPEGQQVDYLILVHSATAYFVRRKTIRSTYAGPWIFSNIRQKTVFLLGETNDPVTSMRIKQEAMTYRDIVQGPFIDSYHNLTHKGVMGFRWASEHCPQAKYIIKIDDDVFLNPFKLVKDFLYNYQNLTKSIICHVRTRGTSPIVRGHGKWQVRDNQFRDWKHYPFDYCNGYFVIITSDLIKPMLRAAPLHPFFWIDDVYLFGLLPQTVGKVTFKNIAKNLTLHGDKMYKCLQDDKDKCNMLGYSQWNEDRFKKSWELTLKNLENSNFPEETIFKSS